MTASAPRGEPSAPRRAGRSARSGTRAPSPQQILSAVRAIPEGFVCTYGDLSPGSPRFAGRVLRATNEDVPWWRVVRADGSLPVGAEQRAQLSREGVPLLATDPPRVDMRRAHVPPPASPRA